MSRDLVERAALNNALWCDAVSATHNGPGEFHDGFWINPLGSPPLYPDIVTLKGEESVSAQKRAIAEWLRSAPSRDCHVKDSFGCLDLHEQRYSPLFDAFWICATRDVAASPPASDSLRWGQVADAGALRDWEACWAGRSGAPDERTFKPSLLSRPEIRFVFAERDGVWVGGGILNFGAAVVGVSNVFASPVASRAVWEGLLRCAQRTRPGSPVVGYEQEGDDLEAALDIGFEKIGRLRVWRGAATWQR